MAFRFESLEIWHLAIAYAEEIYYLTDKFPKHEMFGLASQLRRASVSISSNLAEGSGGSTVKDYKNYLDIAVKSTLETVSELVIAEKRNYIEKITKEEMYEKAETLIRKIRAFKLSLMD
jgi:four helix bundle protein